MNIKIMYVPYRTILKLPIKQLSIIVDIMIMSQRPEWEHMKGAALLIIEHMLSVYYYCFSYVELNSGSEPIIKIT